MEIVSELVAKVPNEWAVFIIAAIPVIELRGAIPVGMAMDMNWKVVYLLSVLGNILPVPFIIWFMRPVFSFLRKARCFKGIVQWLENRTMKKAESVMKYSAFGLFVFVALPLPGTGAWTGAMIASMLDMRMKYALPSIILGVIAAGILVMTLSYHIF